jgi:hypothetical protein
MRTKILSSIRSNRAPLRKKQILYIINTILVVALSYLAFLHFRHREAFVIKLGMSHIATPTAVEIFGYLIPCLNLISLLLIVFYERRFSYFLSGFIFLLYLYYNAYLYIKTGSNCGCANILFNIKLDHQIMLFSFCVAISSIGVILLRKEKKNLKPF